MKLSEFKKQLALVNELNFVLPNGKFVPAHFHVTEIGQVNKHFIDCGGTERKENKVNFQLWEANDFDHRLAPQKLSDIITLSEKVLGIVDGEIEVEYQGETIGKYGLAYNGKSFSLTQTKTNCLASDKCGIPPEKLKVSLSELTTNKQACCTPGSGCC
ncbi:MAG: hypothetical protein IPM51_16080 [Sphingobacteriaceae bacterium]|nr:hypothetical protein [Sphingobacteriaceae bacterium]